MATIYRRLSSVRPTQTATVATSVRGSADSLLRDLAFVLKMTDKVKQQITVKREDADLALAGACHEGV